MNVYVRVDAYREAPTPKQSGESFARFCQPIGLQESSLTCRLQTPRGYSACTHDCLRRFPICRALIGRLLVDGRPRSKTSPDLFFECVVLNSLRIWASLHRLPTCRIRIGSEGVYTQPQR